MNTENNKIILSVLLPTYNYLEGLKKIFSQLELLAIPQIWCYIEICIRDNSDNDYIQNWVEENILGSLPVVYKRNIPPTTPCENWNELIHKSRGRYYILMHHDEFPLTSNFILEALKEIERHKDTDIIVMDCLLMDKSSGSLRRHVPSFIRKKVFERFPEYLFIRNVIGATASLIVKKSLHSSFDCSLEWLIDVDEYYCLRQRAKYWSLSSDLKIGSYIDRGNSITSSLGDKISYIRQQEFKYLLKKHPKALPYLRSNKLCRLLENISWIGMRVITRTYWYIVNSFGKYPVSKEMARKAFIVNR